MFYDPIINDHLPWLNDAGRNYFYKNAIHKTCKDKVCVDVGSGTGILTDYALEAGAKKVYCIEIRKARAKFLKEKYRKNNVEVIEEDFLHTNIKDADIFFLEQIGCQFDNNFSLQRFMSHINGADTIPNKLVLKAYIYDGKILDQPRFLINSDSLPKDFYEHAQENLRIKPVEVLDVYEINKKNCDQDIEFSIDLSHYKDCTIYVDDEVYHNHTRCEYENTYRYWKHKPYKIMLDDAKRAVTFRWNTDKFIFL